MRGRKRKPVGIRMLEGNPSKKPLDNSINSEDINSVIGNSENNGIPKKPKWLSDRARLEWKRLSPYLKNLGLLTPLDRSSFASYCQLYADWVECKLEMRKLKEDGSKEAIKKYKELFRRANQLFEQWKSLATEFGLTPSSRERLSIDKQNLIKDKEWEEFEKLLTQ